MSKEESPRATPLERSVEKPIDRRVVLLKLVFLAWNLALNFNAAQKLQMYVRSATTQLNTYNHKLYDETKQRA